MTKFTLAQQISEVDREIALRHAVYPGLVTRKKMRHGEADEHLARMESVRRTLIWLRENETKLREFLNVEPVA